jgi:hypothetical protein
MANEAEKTGAVTSGRWTWSVWRIAGWSIPAMLLLLPLVAMQFTEEVNWTAEDFVFAAVLFGSVGLAFELIVRKSGSLAYRFGAIGAVVATFLTIWVNGAVGMIGSEGNPYNFLFLGVPFVALLGAILARFKARGMAAATTAAAAVQAALGLYGLSADPLGGAFSTGFAGFWLIAAACFQVAPREGEMTARSVGG